MRIKGLLTKKKLFRFFKIALIVIFSSVVFLSLFGTVAHATGLVDDTVNADNLYSQYPLENYQLDFYVDNSWAGFRGTGWMVSVSPYSTGFTVSPILSGLSVCIYPTPRGTSSSRRISWTSSTTWQTVSAKAYRP